MPTERDDLAVVVSGGTLYAIGGMDWTYNIKTTAEAYDIATNTWRALASMPTARYELAASLVAGTIYVVGGYGSTRLTTSEAYHIETNAWTTMAPMSTPREAPAAGTINGKVYVAGGMSNAGQLASAEVYDPLSNTWSACAPMSMWRYKMAAAVSEGKLWVVGGWSSNVVGWLEAYDPATNTWASKAPMPTARANLAVAFIHGRLFVAGGRNFTSVFNVVEEYDPTTNTWTTSRAMNYQRDGCAGGAIGSRFYVVGGANYLPEPLEVGDLNEYPSLTFAGAVEGFASGLSPANGDQHTAFHFRVRYDDLDGDAPAGGAPVLSIRRSGAPIAGSPFTMVLQSGTASAGEYEHSTTLLKGSAYTYSFAASDVRGGPADTIGGTGPTVMYLASLDEMAGKLANQPLMIVPNKYDPAIRGNVLSVFAKGNAFEPAVVRMYDELGALRRTLTLVLNADGRGVVRFAADDDQGNPLPAGVYWAIGTGGGVTGKTPFVVARGAP